MSFPLLGRHLRSPLRGVAASVCRFTCQFRPQALFRPVMPNWINYCFAAALALIIAALIASFFI
jgi:hypothetical protein